MISRPSSPFSKRRRRGWLHRCEVMCCGILTYFPLAVVIGMTTWAVWVVIQIGMLPSTPFGTGSAVLGFVAYFLLNWSYLTAVFTDPGSPASSQADTVHHSSVMVKSTGEMRFCKKCQTRKPDRTHHCSSCRRCVLKMDHHCPWLATCVGMRNYKAFLLFLAYTSLFCWLAFAVSGSWLWREVTADTAFQDENMMPAHFIILSVISGIIGLVISGFTGYHLYLTSRNRTTIESLEKTKYLSPVKLQASQQITQHQAYDYDQPHSFGEQLRDLGNTLTEIHANALPGVLRPEEGEERMSPAQNSLTRQLDWNEYSRRREQQQYEDYLDDRDNEKLPNAFDLGWRRNLRAVLGPTKWLWLLPICNSIGDGWQWEQNEKWKRQCEILREEREAEMQRQADNARFIGHADSRSGAQDVERGLSKADRVLGRTPGQFYDATSKVPRQKLPRREDLQDIYDSDDEETDGKSKLLRKWPKSAAAFDPHPGTRVQDNWNDVPDEMLGYGGSSRSR